MSSCVGGLPATGLFQGEESLMVLQIVSTLMSFTVVSAWVNRDKTKKLSLFFAHWLAGLVTGLFLVAEDAMVTVCWTGSDLEGLIKAMRFIELSAFNIFALTNLAICVNLALIVSSHRTLSPVKSVSSPAVLLVLLVISMAAAAPIIPFGEFTLVSGTGFYMVNTEEAGQTFIQLSWCYVQFFVGVCMFVIVAWLLIFRTKELKECWKTHARFRFYVEPTLVGTAVHLGLGVCGTIDVVSEEFEVLYFVWSWAFRYIQVALDTLNLYGVFREGNIDERGDGSATGSDSGVSNLPSEASGVCDDTSKPTTTTTTTTTTAATAAPPV